MMLSDIWCMKVVNVINLCTLSSQQVFMGYWSAADTGLNYYPDSLQHLSCIQKPFFYRFSWQRGRLAGTHESDKITQSYSSSTFSDHCWAEWIKLWYCKESFSGCLRSCGLTAPSCFWGLCQSVGQFNTSRHPNWNKYAISTVLFCAGLHVSQ